MKQSDTNLEIKERVFNMHRNVKYLREKHGLTTKQLAEIIGISEKKLILAESCTDTRCFYAEHFKNICEYFQVKADVLLHERLY